MVDIVSLPITVVKDISNLGKLLQTLGLVVIIAIIFDVISYFSNRKRLKEIDVIKKDMARIESKIDKIIYNRKK